MTWLRMRRPADTPLPTSVLPEGIDIRLVGEAVAPACRALMNDAYGTSEGEAPTPFAPWWRQLRADSEFDPGLCRAALSGDRVVGYCHGWRVPFVKDLVVASDWRRRGLASALLSQLIRDYAQRGAGPIELKTDVNNVAGQRLYRRFGFEEIERIAIVPTSS